jgi:threonine dehydratase
MQGTGAEIIFHGAVYDEAQLYCEVLAQEHGYRYIHSGNEPLLIAAVATETLEMLEDEPGLEVIIVPIGGGSGTSGACIVTRVVNSSIRVIGVQAEASPAAYESWRQGQLVEVSNRTMAEGLATGRAFELPQAIMRQMLEEFMLVSQLPPAKAGGLCLGSTATQRISRDALLWLLRSTHQGQLTSAPFLSSLAG